MKKMVFITGGTRSGKSTMAVKLAREGKDKNVIFIATCLPEDEEILKRIGGHRKSRPKNWITIEEHQSVSNVLRTIPITTDVVIIDCLTLLISNLMFSGKGDGKILAEIKMIIKEAKKRRFLTIIVSNEVGSGIVPENKIARDFRDLAGKANQIMAKYSDEIYAMISGIPLKLK